MMKKIGLSLLFISALAFGTDVQSNTSNFEGVRSFSLGLGNLNRFPGTAQTDDQGSREHFTFHPVISASFFYDFNPSLTLNPELIIGAPQKGRDKKIKTNQFYLLTHGGYRFHPRWQLRIGAGLSFYRISSDGGTQELRNGPIMVEFPMPEQSVVSRNFIISTGIEYKWRAFNHPMSAKIQTFFYNLLESDAKAWAHTLSLHFHFDSPDWKRASR